MAKNTLADLRNHLFETLEELKDEDKPLDIGRAHAIAHVAETIISSAKIELRAAEVLGRESLRSALWAGGPADLEGKPQLNAGNPNGRTI